MKQVTFDFSTLSSVVQAVYSRISWYHECYSASSLKSFESTYADYCRLVHFLKDVGELYLFDSYYCEVK